MSVLLQGLSMPKGNPRTINIYRDGVWCDAYTTENGKAIEVPPHGRLIDADALKVDHFVTSTTTNSTIYRYVSKKQIDEATTIIPAEEGE